MRTPRTDTIARARELRALRDSGISTSEAAARHGLKRPYAENLIRLLTLPDDVIALIESGKLSAFQAIPLIGLPPETARALAIADGLTAAERRAKALWHKRDRDARGLSPAPAPADAAAPPPSPAPRPPTLSQLGTAERYRRRANEHSRDLRRALKRIDDLGDLVRAYERYTAEPIRCVPPAVLTPGRRPAAAVALLSDVHAEERVDRTDAIDNHYTLEVAQERVGRFFAGASWLVRQATAFDVSTLVVWLGGDLITGDIHDELLERAAVPPGAATMMVRDWIVAGIRRLLVELPGVQIVVPCSVGNHGRTTRRMNAATGYGHSWEWVLYQVLGHDFDSEPRVQIHSSHDEMQYVEVFDRVLAFHHGHRMRYNGGIGGLTIPAVKAMHRWQQWRECDYYHFGHFHTYVPDVGSMTFNGSVIGPSPYSFAIGASPEAPQQAFYLLDAKRGKTGMHPIWVAK